MPADEVAFLRGTLGLYLGTSRVEEILRLFGRRMGRSMAVLDPDAPDVAATVGHLAAQVGLGKVITAPWSDPSSGARDALGRGGTGARSPEGSRGRWAGRDRGEEGVELSGWALLLDRLAERLPAGEPRAQPVFTAGFIEGLFEGILGGRVHGELRKLGSGRWELEVGLLPLRGPKVPGTARFRLPGPRAYRWETQEGGEFFERLAPYLVPGSTLGFAREAPRRLRAEFGYGNAELHWFAVTFRPGESIISPRQVGHVVEVTESFLMHRFSNAAAPLVFLQGLDYLANRNEPRTVVRLVEVVKERVVSARGSLVVELPLDGLDREIVAQLRRELSSVLPEEGG